MKTIFTSLKLLFLSLIFSQVVAAQNIGDYQTTASGNWSSSASWARWDGFGWITPSTPPTSTDGVIAILNTHSITINAPVTADQIIVNSGGTLNINVFISGSGGNDLTLTDGTGTDLEVNGSLTLGTFNRLQGSGTVVINGTMTWTSGTIAVPTTINGGALLSLSGATEKIINTTITNNGTINWPNASIRFNNSTLNNNGQINATGDNTMLNTSGVNALNNNSSGVFTKSVGVGTSYIAIPLNNSGTININTGIISNNTASAVFTNTGTINFSNTTLSNDGGTVNFNSGTVITGTSNYTNGSFSTTNINIPLSLSNATFVAGTIQGSGSLVLTNSLNWQGSTLDINTTLENGATGNFNTFGKNLNANFINNGTVSWNDGSSGGSISLTDATFTNNGTINESFTNTNRGFFHSTGSNAVINNGLINKTSTFQLQTNSGLTFTNNNILQGIGTYSFSGSVINTGTIAPGNSPGILGLSANLITGQTPTIRIELLGLEPNPPVAGTDYDQLTFNAASVDVSGTTLIVEENTSTTVASYTIMINNGGVFTGNFAAVVIPLNYSITYNPGVSTSIVVTKLGSTLPAVWGNFNALAKNNNRVNLNWSTLQENNVSHYTVEYSANGRDYTSIGTIAAAGNTTDVTNYSFVHNTPDVQKTNYYRIRQSDLDGKTAYSVIRPVRFSKGTVAPILVTPNPVRDRLQLSVQAENIRIMLVDLSGRTLKNMNLQPGNHELSVSELAPGMYHLVIFQDGLRLETQKIIKQ